MTLVGCSGGGGGSTLGGAGSSTSADSFVGAWRAAQEEARGENRVRSETVIFFEATGRYYRAARTRTTMGNTTSTYVEPCTHGTWKHLDGDRVLVSGEKVTFVFNGQDVDKRTETVENVYTPKVVGELLEDTEAAPGTPGFHRVAGASTFGECESADAVDRSFPGVD